MGKDCMEMKVGLTFVCMNLTKYIKKNSDIVSLSPDQLSIVVNCMNRITKIINNFSDNSLIYFLYKV